MTTVDAVPVDLSGLRAVFGLLPILGFVVVIGAILAVLPLLLGASVMQMLSDISPTMRLPAMWGLADGAGGAGIAVALDPAMSTQPVVIAFAATGAGCAAIFNLRSHHADP